MSGNLKPAPFALTPALVGKLLGDRPAYGAGIARLPIEGVLVDRSANEDPTRPSTWSNPAIAEANDA